MIIAKQKCECRITRLLALFVIVLAGCVTPKKTPPKLNFSSPQGTKIETSGDAQEPAKVETENRQTEIPLPVDSQVSFVEAVKDPVTNVTTVPAKTVVTLAQASVFRSSAKLETVTAPKAFQPPVAPTPTEIAQGDIVAKAFYVSAALVVIGLVLFYLQHGKAGMFAILGGIIVPALCKFANSTYAIVALGVVVTASTVFVVSWHLLKRRGVIVEPVSGDSFRTNPPTN